MFSQFVKLACRASYRAVVSVCCTNQCQFSVANRVSAHMYLLCAWLTYVLMSYSVLQYLYHLVLVYRVLGVFNVISAGNTENAD